MPSSLSKRRPLHRYLYLFLRDYSQAYLQLLIAHSPPQVAQARRIGFLLAVEPGTSAGSGCAMDAPIVACDEESSGCSSGCFTDAEEDVHGLFL